MIIVSKHTYNIFSIIYNDTNQEFKTVFELINMYPWIGLSQYNNSIDTNLVLYFGENITLPIDIEIICLIHNVKITNFNEIKDTCKIEYSEPSFEYYDIGAIVINDIPFTYPKYL